MKFKQQIYAPYKKIQAKINRRKKIGSLLLLFSNKFRIVRSPTLGFLNLFNFVRDFMKHLLLAVLLTLPFTTFAYDKSKCAESNLISISFSAEVFDSRNFDIGNEYKAYANKVTKVAEKEKIKGFKIINQSFSMSNYSGFTTHFDIQVDDTYSALKAFYSNMQAASFSHNYHADTCKD